MTTIHWRGAGQPRDLSDADFAAAAGRLGCDPSAIRAVWEVEAAGRGFRADGSVERRFEPHHMPRRHWPAMGFAPAQGQAAWRASLAVSAARREAMFRAAYAADSDAALRATSWGGAQIMGFNALEAGFGSAADMVTHMAKGAPQQLGAFVQLVEGWRLAGALRARDWQGFARRWNGDGQVEVYARRMESAYRRHSGARSPQVLRVGDRGPAVTRLQRALGVAEDGAFGPETLRAVRAFQSRASLPVDGVVGAVTWAAIESGATDALPVVPPVQETTAEAMLDRARDGAAAIGAVSAALAALREALPDTALTILVAASAVCLVLAGAAWCWRRVRA